MSGHGNHSRTAEPTDERAQERRRLARAAEEAQEEYSAQAERLHALLEGDEDYEPEQLGEIEDALSEARSAFRVAAIAYRDATVPSTDPAVVVLTLRRDPGAFDQRPLPV